MARERMVFELRPSARGWRLYSQVQICREITDRDAATWNARDALEIVIGRLRHATIEIITVDEDGRVVPPGEDPA